MKDEQKLEIEHFFIGIKSDEIVCCFFFFIHIVLCLPFVLITTDDARRFEKDDYMLLQINSVNHMNTLASTQEDLVHYSKKLGHYRIKRIKRTKGSKKIKGIEGN
jgi:hypothetical protein